MTTDFSLKDSSTYLKTWDISLDVIKNNYKHLVSEYFMFVMSNQDQIPIKDVGIFRYILVRGLHTITHIFKNMLLHTNNIDASLFHAQRGICLYVEFITQISQNHNAFIKLTSRDAVQYVYKKTIFCLRERVTDTHENPHMDDMNSLLNEIMHKIGHHIVLELEMPKIRNSDIDTIGDLMNTLKIEYSVAS
jgi:hypothetical protein